MRLALPLAIAFAFTSAKAGDYPRLNPANGVVLPLTLDKSVLVQCSRPSPENIQALWEPETRQIDELEARLPAALAARSDGSFKPPKNFIRQYVGIVRGGRKLIYVNAYALNAIHDVPGEPPFDWKHEFLMVCDGGAAFFGIEYDPQTRTFDHFAYNGVA